MNKIALVTGASSGIGKALVDELLGQGYEVVGISRSVEEKRGDRLSLYSCDVGDRESVKRVCEELRGQNKVPSLFFLNAGIAGLAAMESTECLDFEKHEKIFTVNYYGPLNFVGEWLEPCKERGSGTFVVTSSINAVFAPPGGSAYAASKAAISKAFDGLRLTHRELKFLSVFCGPVDTPGLAGKLPFTWTAEKMAKYMIRVAKREKRRSNPSWFYTGFAKILNVLPEKMVMKIITQK